MGNNVFDKMISRLSDVEFIQETILNEQKSKEYSEEFETKYADYQVNSKERRNNN